MKNDIKFRPPLSKTAVLNLGKWGPLTTGTKNIILIGLNSSICRRPSVPTYDSFTNIEPFKSADITICYNFRYSTSFKYEVFYRFGSIIFEDFRSICNYFYDFYFDTIFFQKYKIGYQNQVWKSPI